MDQEQILAALLERVEDFTFDCEVPDYLSEEYEEFQEGITRDMIKGLLPKKVLHALKRTAHKDRYKMAIKLYYQIKNDKSRKMTDNMARITAAELVGINPREFEKVLDKETRYESFEITEDLDPLIMAAVIQNVGMLLATSIGVYAFGKGVSSWDDVPTTRLSGWKKFWAKISGSEKRTLKQIQDLAKTDPDIADVMSNGLGNKGFKAGYRIKFENALKKHGLEKEWKKLGDRLSRYAREMNEENQNGQKYLKPSVKPTGKVLEDGLPETTKAYCDMTPGQTYDEIMSIISEKAPPDKDIETWLKKNKQRFIDEYGQEDYAEYLYGRAWNMYNKKHGKTEQTNKKFKEFMRNGV